MLSPTVSSCLFQLGFKRNKMLNEAGTWESKNWNAQMNHQRLADFLMTQEELSEQQQASLWWTEFLSSLEGANLSLYHTLISPEKRTNKAK